MVGATRLPVPFGTIEPIAIRFPPKFHFGHALVSRVSFWRPEGPLPSNHFKTPIFGPLFFGYGISLSDFASTRGEKGCKNQSF